MRGGGSVEKGEKAFRIAGGSQNKWPGDDNDGDDDDGNGKDVERSFIHAYCIPECFLSFDTHELR